MKPVPDTSAPRPAPGPRADEPVEVQAEAILGGAREIVILHKGARYRLRVTQSDKLILTK